MGRPRLGKHLLVGVNVKLPLETIEQLDDWAFHHDCTRSSAARQLLQRGLAFKFALFPAAHGKLDKRPAPAPKKKKGK